MNFWKDFSEKNNFIIDVSAGSIGVALVRHYSKSLPQIISSNRATFHLSKEVSLEAKEKGMIKALREALKRTGKIEGEIDNIFISFSAPWLLSHLESRTLNSTTPFLLDEQAITAILAEEEAAFRKKLKEEYVEETTVFESKVTGIYQNGYRAKLPMHRKVNTAEIRFMMSATKTDLIQKIENQILQIIGIKKPPFLSSFMNTFLDVLTGAFKDVHSALLVSQTSETTDLLFLNQGSSIMCASIPFGLQQILDEISVTLDIPEQIAYSYLALFAEGDLDEKISTQIDQILAGTEKKLQEYWTTTGFDLEARSDHPFIIFLVGLHPIEIISKSFVKKLFPGHEIITIDEDSKLTKNNISLAPHITRDERLILLSTVSKFIR